MVRAESGVMSVSYPSATPENTPDTGADKVVDTRLRED